MTNDKTLPEDEAGDDETLASASADPSEDTTPEVADDPAGENLAVDDGRDDEANYKVVDDEAEELTEAEDVPDDTPDKGDPEDMVIDDEEQLAEAETVAAKAKSSRPVKRKVTTAPVKKDKPTPKQKDAKGGDRVEKKRITPAKFVSQSASELKKVIWPNGDQLREYFIVVLVFVLFIITLVSLLDLGFGRLLLWLLA